MDIKIKSPKTKTEFKKQRNKLPNNFPKDPQSYYRRKGTWKSWPDFFGVKHHV